MTHAEQVPGRPAETPSESLLLADRLGLAGALLLGALLWGPVLLLLGRQWGSDSSLSHGPVVLLLALGLLYARRQELARFPTTCPTALLLVLPCALGYWLACFADMLFPRALALLGLTLGAIWLVAGPRAFRAASGALGLIAFVIPWPTTLVERLAFPLQLISSAYAATAGGILGLPIVREGVQLAVVPNPHAKPIFSILVAQKCSGLTSLLVLLVVGYLIAYFTPVRPLWRALMVAAIVPLTLLANATRLTFILLAGAHSSPALAQWVHDHETPVLVLLCSLGLLALRQALLTWQPAAPATSEGSLV